MYGWLHSCAGACGGKPAIYLRFWVTGTKVHYVSLTVRDPSWHFVWPYCKCDTMRISVRKYKRKSEIKDGISFSSWYHQSNYLGSPTHWCYVGTCSKEAWPTCLKGCWYQERAKHIKNQNISIYQKVSHLHKLAPWLGLSVYSKRMWPGLQTELLFLSFTFYSISLVQS